MNGNSTTDDNISKVVGDNNAADGIDEATKKTTSSVVDVASSRSMTDVDDNTSRRKQHHHTRRKNQQQQQQQQQQMQQKGMALSGGSTTDNDTSYCTEIARRAVARGALHLGFEGMEGEALDVLGNVLLGYMEMVRPFFFIYIYCVQKIKHFCCLLFG
jgi:hypothetical protein